MESTSAHLVGRARELGELAGLVEDALASRGRLAVVSGEAGIGKTRLCQELARLAGARGMSAAWSACWESSGLPPFWPWSQLLGQMGAVMPSAAGGESAPEAARAGLFASVGDALRGAAAYRPWLLVIDDVHWADAETVRLISYLAPLVRSMQVLIVATVRDGAEPGATLAAALDRQGQAILLGGLSPDEVRALAAQLTGADPEREVVAELHRATAGNPLFVAELARYLHRDNGLAALAGSDPLPVPPTVRAVLGERLAALSAGCCELLEYCAVAGSEFSLPQVAAAAEQDLRGVLEVIGEAVAARIVRMTGPGTAAFCHPLMRSVVYDDIGVARRAGLHCRVAEAIEGRAVTLDDADLAALAYHYFMAASRGAAAKAAAFSARAAARAMRNLAYDEAAGLFDRALAAHELDPAGTDRAELLLGAARARAAAGNPPAARRLFMAAAGSARSAGHANQLARAALGLAGSGFEVTLFDDDQVALLEEALEAVGTADAALRSGLQARLSVALSLSGDEDRRNALAVGAVALAKASGDDAAVAAALAARCDVQAGPAYVRQRSADAETIVAIARTRGDHGAELLGRRLRLLASLEAGDLQAFDREVHDFGQLADRLRQPAYQWYARLWRAARAATRGRLAEQARLAGEAETMGRAAGSPNVEILLLAHRHFVWLESGDTDTYLAETERLTPPGSWAQMGIQMLPLAIMRPLYAGRPAEARAVLDRSADQLAAAPRDAEWLTLLAQVGDLCAKLGGHPVAGWLYDTLLPYAELWSVDGIAAYIHGPVHRQLGTLAALLGRADPAAEHFTAALTANRAAGADLLAARTLLDRGVALNDRVALGAARDAYHALGLGRLVATIDGLLEPGPPAGPNRLRREGDVWAICFAGRECRVRDSKGLTDLARLLARPAREIPALDLAAPGGAPPQGHLGEIIDQTARAAYKARLAELSAALDDADILGDTERSARLEADRDAILGQLTTAYGLAGRPRRAGDPAERARTAVTARIRDAIRRIETVHPELGRHLSHSVRTGTMCSYDPEPPAHWDT